MNWNHRKSEFRSGTEISSEDSNLYKVFHTAERFDMMILFSVHRFLRCRSVSPHRNTWPLANR